MSGKECMQNITELIKCKIEDRLELVKKYIFDLMTPETDKICNLIKTLNMVYMAIKR